MHSDPEPDLQPEEQQAVGKRPEGAASGSKRAEESQASPRFADNQSEPGETTVVIEQTRDRTAQEITQIKSELARIQRELA